MEVDLASLKVSCEAILKVQGLNAFGFEYRYALIEQRPFKDIIEVPS